MIKVAQMMTEMNYGGVEAVIMNYYRHIDRTKVQFDFFCFEGSSLPMKEEIESLGGHIYVLPKITRLFSYLKKCERLFKDNSYDIVHSNMNALSVFSLYAAKKAGIKVRIAHSHSTAGKGEMTKNLFKYLLRPFSKRYATHLLACSDIAGSWLFGNNADYKILHNAIDTKKFRFDEKIRDQIRQELGIEDKKVIGHIGRFCYQKNHDLLIDVFAGVHEKDKDTVLLLIGEGELEKEIKNKVKDLALEDSVLFLGKRKDAYLYYNAMDLFLLPSRYEGLPVVGVEAQCAGLPCVFSSFVTKEAKITDTTVFVKNDIDSYLQTIMKDLSVKRKDQSSDIRKAGYDIDVEAAVLLRYYQELSHE